jgi:ribosomal protein S6--L-glutamate ligase
MAVAAVAGWDSTGSTGHTPVGCKAYNTPLFFPLRRLSCMKIAILSRKPELYSTQRLVQAAGDRGHEAQVINPLRCYMDITSARPAIYHAEKKLEGFDAVIPRIGASITFYGMAVLRQFEMMDVYPLNESVAIGRSRDKLRSQQLLARAGVGLPITGFAHTPDDIKSLIPLVGGPPLIIKLLEGTQGKGVILAETVAAAESMIDAFRKLDANFLVQEYVKEAGGRDMRCFVIGGRVVAAMMRTAKEGEFRSNLHRGGTGSAVELSDEEQAMAVQAAETMGLNVAGVDMLRSRNGPLVLEVNSSPGLRGIESVTRKDIAGLIVEFIEAHARLGEPAGRRYG